MMAGYKKVKRIKCLHVFQSFLYIVLLGFCICIVGLLLLGFKPAVVMSGSMEPAIKTGSICFINENAVYDDMQENDVIAFHSGNINVTHRIVAVSDDGFITKGDANDAADMGYVSRDNFIGETVFSVPYIGYGVKFINTIPGIIISITLIIAFALIALLIKDDSFQKKDEVK